MLCDRSAKRYPFGSHKLCDGPRTYRLTATRDGHPAAV